MSTSKIIIAGTLLLVSSMLYGAAAHPDSILFSFASVAPEYTDIRIALGVVLLGLLLSSPPRSIVFRAIIGVASLALVTTTSYYFFSYGMSVIDAVIFMQAAIIFGIEALEPRSARHSNVVQPARRRTVAAS